MEATWPTGGFAGAKLECRDYRQSTPTRRTIRNCIPAKSLGRWRSGCPAGVGTDKADPELGATYAQQRLQIRKWIRTAYAARSDRRATHQPGDNWTT